MSGFTRELKTGVRAKLVLGITLVALFVLLFPPRVAAVECVGAFFLGRPERSPRLEQRGRDHGVGFRAMEAMDTPPTCSDSLQNPLQITHPSSPLLQ